MTFAVLARFLLFLQVPVVLSAAAQIAITTPGAPTRHASTLDAALAAARLLRPVAHGPILITLPAGMIRLVTPVVLNQTDSGSAIAPLIIRGSVSGTTILSGTRRAATRTSADGTQVVNLAPVAATALDRSAEVPPFPVLVQGLRRLEVATWPVTGFDRRWHGIGDTIVGPVPLGTTGTPLIVGGYPRSGWLYELALAHRRGAIVQAIVTASRSPRDRLNMRLLNAGPIGIGRFLWRRDTLRATVRELPDDAPIAVAVAPTLLKIEGTAYVRIEEVALVGSVRDAVQIHNGSHIVLANCLVAATGGGGIVVSGGDHVTIDRCTVADTGLTAVSIGGGDRLSLTSAGHRLIDSIVVRFGLDKRTYAPGASLWGVGVEVTGSRFAAAPHSAILIAGNDHLIEGNDISHVVCEAQDSGAIYMGRDWTARGTQIRGNIVHDSGSTEAGSFTSAIYLDDQASGTIVEGNILVRTGIGVVIGGGRDNMIDDNVIAQTVGGAVYVDDRGANVQAAGTPIGDFLLRSLRASPYRTLLWQQRYPTLLSLAAPGPPAGNRLVGNVSNGTLVVAKGAAHVNQRENRTVDLRGDVSLGTLAGLLPARTAQPVRLAPPLRFAPAGGFGCEAIGN